MTDCYTCLCEESVYCKGMCKVHYDHERYHLTQPYIKKKGRKYYKNNKIKIDKYNNEWRKNNPEKVLVILKRHLEKYGKLFNMTPNEYMYAVNSWSKTIKKMDNYICKLCNSKKNIQAHHIQPKQDFPKLCLELNNGVTLCENCHENIHGFEIYQH